jgi:hypothetical protein
MAVSDEAPTGAIAVPRTHTRDRQLTDARKAASSALRDRDTAQTQLEHETARRAELTKAHRHVLGLRCECGTQLSITCSQPIEPERHAMALATTAVSLRWRMSRDTAERLSQQIGDLQGLSIPSHDGPDLCPWHGDPK